MGICPVDKGTTTACRERNGTCVGPFRDFHSAGGQIQEEREPEQVCLVRVGSLSPPCFGAGALSQGLRV